MGTKTLKNYNIVLRKLPRIWEEKQRRYSERIVKRLVEKNKKLEIHLIRISEGREWENCQRNGKRW